jgi:hypothetical protein
MANYYTELSFMLDLPNSEAVQHAVDLAELLNGIAGENVPKPSAAECSEALFDMVIESGFGIDVEADGNAVWIHADECPNLDALDIYVQHLLSKYEIKELVRVEWASTCDRPRTESFGGGIMLITAAGSRYMSTDIWQPPIFDKTDELVIQEIAHWALKGMAGADIISQLDISDEETYRLSALLDARLNPKSPNASNPLG